MTDLGILVTPLDGNPVGPDLAYDDMRIAIEGAFATSSEGDRAAEANWPQTIDRILAQAQLTRDLWLGIYLARAGVRSGQLDVVAQGVQLLATLVENLWDDVHPQLDEVGFQGRKSACDSLASHPDFIQPLKRVVLIGHPRLGSYSAADLERFDQQGDAAEGYGKFRAAIEQLDDEIIDSAVDRVDSIRDALRRVDAVLVANAGEETGTDFQPTYDVLAQMRQGLARYSRTAAVADMDASDDADGAAFDTGAATAAGAGSSVPARIESRDDVVRAIESIADYYRRREPGSAVPIALRRAREWVSKSFLEVLEDIAPASMDDARRVLMSQSMVAELERD